MGNRGSKSEFNLKKVTLYIILGFMLLKSLNFNYFMIDNSLKFLPAPIVIYENSDLNKLEILKDNKGKSGIYGLIKIPVKVI